MWLSKRSWHSTRTLGGSLTAIRCPRNSRMLPRVIRASCLCSRSHSWTLSPRVAAVGTRGAGASAVGRAASGRRRRARERERLAMSLHDGDEFGHARSVIVLLERPPLTRSCDGVTLLRVVEVMSDQLRAVCRVLVRQNLFPRHEELGEIRLRIGEQEASHPRGLEEAKVVCVRPREVEVTVDGHL